MTAIDLDRTLAEYFETDALAPAPADLLEITLAGTSNRRPRPRWRAVVDAPTVGFAAIPVVRLLVAVALIAVVIAAIAIGVGGTVQRPFTFEPVGPMPFSGQFPVRTSNDRILLVEDPGFAGAWRPRIAEFHPADRTFAIIGEVRLFPLNAVALRDGSILLLGHDDNQHDGGVNIVARMHEAREAKLDFRAAPHKEGVRGSRCASSAEARWEPRSRLCQ